MSVGLSTLTMCAHSAFSWAVQHTILCLDIRLGLTFIFLTYVLRLSSINETRYDHLSETRIVHTSMYIEKK